MSDDLSLPNNGYRGNRPGRYGAGGPRSRRTMEPATRRLVLFAAGVGSVLVGLIGASAIVGRHGTEVPVVTADSRPVRERPADPGGMKVDGADNELLSGASDTSHARLAPPAETPDPAALYPAAVPAAPLTVPPPAPAPNLPTAPSTDTPAVTTIVPPPLPAPVAVKPPAPIARQAVVIPAVPAVVSPAPGSAVPAAAKPAPAKPQVAATEAHQAATEAHSVATGHQPVVQLAAVTSEEGAKQEWDQLSKRMPDLLKGHQPNYSRTERDGHTFWRIRTTGFVDVGQARSFCEHVHAKGGGCSVADF